MTEIDRRAAAALMVFAPLASAGLIAPPALAAAPRGAGAPSRQRSGPDHIAMLIYPGMTILDMIGPNFFFANATNTKVHLVAKSLDPVTSDTGVTVTPTHSFDDCPMDLTVLFTGGGGEGTLHAMEDAATRAFMADRGARADYVTSVCTGALILGAAGLLKGYKATTHWSARAALPAYGAILAPGRVVRDRNRFTGGGVTAGIDFGMTLIAELRGEEEAQRLQLIGEYDPHPPYNAGSPTTAPRKIVDDIVKFSADMTQKWTALAQTI